MAVLPVLLAVLALAPVVARAQAHPTTILPLEEVRPGMEGIVSTVFEGGRLETFRAEIIGVLDNFLGPNQDLILARLHGDKVEFTGVAAGMSGSPVTIDGRLVGALSYRIGTFMKEPIAGITPIEYMLDVAASRPEIAKAHPMAETAVPAGGGLEPIDTPIVVSGVSAAVLAEFAEDLGRLGLDRTVAGASVSESLPIEGAPEATPSPLRPGDPVAAQLVRGDVSFAATGTVTHLDGNRVYAFGHPAFLMGETELPMARAEIYLTLSSMQASTKMSRIRETIGTFRQSRLPGLTGVIGPVPRMIPVSLDVRAEGYPRRSFGYEIVAQRDFAPVLVGLVTANSMVNTPWVADEMTLALSGRIELEGHPDVLIEDIYVGFTATQSAALAMARDVQGLFGAVYQNRYEKPKIEAIHLEVNSVETAQIGVVEGVYPTRTQLEPGEEVEFRVLIRPFRGDAYTKTFRYTIPRGTPPGRLKAQVGGSGVLAASEQRILSRQIRQAGDLGELISIINELRKSDKLYLKITRQGTGAIVHHEILSNLPPSIYSTLGSSRETGEVTPLRETALHEESLAMDKIIVGGTSVLLTVK